MKWLTKSYLIAQWSEERAVYDLHVLQNSTADLVHHSFSPGGSWTGEHPERRRRTLCSNHISNFDPPTVGIKIRRQVRFMAKSELFDVPVLGPIIKAVGAFPVKRRRQQGIHQNVTQHSARW